MPGPDKPACGNVQCARLAAEVWPALRERSATAIGGGKRENWMRRAEMECGICKTERTRRCCVRAETGDGAHRHLEPPFAAAPFIHPFRHPSYHATQLRAMNFAKAACRRVHWMVACDKMADGSQTATNEKVERRKDRWLQFHDRFTSGIPRF